MSNDFITNGFSTRLPDGWVDRSVISLVNPNAADGFATNVVVLREQVAPNTNIEQYAREQLAAIAAGVGNHELLDQRAVEIQNNPAYELLQRFVAGDRRIQQAQTYILHENTVFAVTCTAPLEEFNRAIPAFREILENLRFD